MPSRVAQRGAAVGLDRVFVVGAGWALPAILIAVLAIVAAGARPGASFVGPPAPPVVRYDDGRVTVIAEGESLAGVMDALAAATGMQLRGSVPEDRRVTVRMTDVPLEVAIERLLGSHNFTMRFAADGSPSRLTLRGVPVVSARPPGGAPRGRTVFLKRWRQHPPVRIGGPLAAALGSQAVRLPQLARAVGTLDDPRIRRLAMAHILASIERDPTLQAGLRDMTPAQIATFARARANANAHELAAYLARRASDPTVRDRARQALAALR